MSRKIFFLCLSVLFYGCCTTKKITESEARITVPVPVAFDTMTAYMPVRDIDTSLSYTGLFDKAVMARINDSSFVLFTGSHGKARWHPKTGKIEVELKPDNVSTVVKVKQDIEKEPWYKKAWDRFVFTSLGWMLGTIAAIIFSIVLLFGRKS